MTPGHGVAIHQRRRARHLMLLALDLFLLVALGTGGDSAFKSMIEDCRS
ncbi:hypothetical protein [Ectopseudomonas alcaliphila]|nr:MULTISPECIES: hypothetical protein [Pseudomonas]MDP9941443.1 hypothetical protein [Pseudomonas sp. 3400]MDR7013662.1 hypothetical protein [Pseudomonas alcaliphila]